MKVKFWCWFRFHSCQVVSYHLHVDPRVGEIDTTGKRSKRVVLYVGKKADNPATPFWSIFGLRDTTCIQKQVKNYTIKIITHNITFFK